MSENKTNENAAPEQELSEVERMMLAILFGNMFAPLIDYCVVDRNISRRSKRGAQKNANQ